MSRYYIETSIAGRNAIQLWKGIVPQSVPLRARLAVRAVVFAFFTLTFSGLLLALPVAELSSGVLTREKGMMLYLGTPFTGYSVERYPGGLAKSKTQWVEGKRHGSYQVWHPNGQLFEERSYRFNRKHGTHRSWFDDGSRRFVLNFKDGRYHGKCEEWYADGIKYLETHYELGEEIGSQKAWQPDGTIRANYVVRNGKRYGIIGSRECVTVIE